MTATATVTFLDGRIGTHHGIAPLRVEADDIDDFYGSFDGSDSETDILMDAIRAYAAPYLANDSVSRFGVSLLSGDPMRGWIGKGPDGHEYADFTVEIASGPDVTREES